MKDHKKRLTLETKLQVFQQLESGDGMTTANIKCTCEGASDDNDAVARFPLKLKAIGEAEGYKPQQVFHANETGLFWKCMPSRIYIKDCFRLSGSKG